MSSNAIFIGVNAHVAAVDKSLGRVLWKTKLKGGLAGGDRFVTLLVEDNRIYAHTGGELFCLDVATGKILWNNKLEGLGYDVANLAAENGLSSSVPVAEYYRKSQQEDTGS